MYLNRRTTFCITSCRWAFLILLPAAFGWAQTSVPPDEEQQKPPEFSETVTVTAPRMEVPIAAS